MRVMPVRGAVAIVLLAACAMASADEIADARDLLRRNLPEQAFALLEPLERSRAGEVEFDYLLGITALDAQRLDRAVIAFERVLVASPDFKSARFDLGRAYYALGADDLAQQEFERLMRASPTPEGARAIQAFLDAIERRRRGPERRVRAFVELAAGHDSNLSSTTPDFSNAIDNAFGIPGVTPTGNSVLRSSTFGSVAAGVGGALPLARGFEAVGSLELRARNHRRHGEFDYRLADAQAGIAWRRDELSIQAVATGQAFRQDGATPAPLEGTRPTSDRNATGINVEARRALGKRWEVFGVAQWTRLRYPSNPSQDTDQAYATAGVLHASTDPWPGLLLLSAFHSVDSALRPINAATPQIDVGRSSSGVRGYAQRDFARGIHAYLLASWSRRVDDSPFARATAVEIGRDRLAELSLGVVVPLGRWSLRPSVTHLDNRSNIALYSFRKTEGAIALRYEFP